MQIYRSNPAHSRLINTQCKQSVTINLRMGLRKQRKKQRKKKNGYEPGIV